MSEEANQAEQPKALDTLLAEAQAKVEEHRDAWMRALAEAENTRKRAQADVQSAHKYGAERVIEMLLPVADSLEASLADRSSAPEALRGGVELTLKQLQAAFEKARVTAISPAAGERFDPHRHQAMAAVETQAEPNTVVSVLQKGYALHDRVLRPALVTVAKALENSGENPISGKEPD